jgi:hypothetical protein
MNDDRTLERAARSWLEAGPIEAPDHAVEAALLRVQTTHQERDVRVPWRAPSMFGISSRYLVAAAVAIAVFVGGALLLRPGGNSSVGGPSPAPSASHTTSAASSPAVRPSSSLAPAPTPTPTLVDIGLLTQSHASDLYRYQVRYPPAWQLEAGIADGVPDDIPSDLSLRRDDFYSDTASGSGHGLMVTSAPLGTMTDLAGWTALVTHQVGTKFGSYLHFSACDQPTRSLVLDGEPANEVDFKCPGATWLWVTAIHGGRTYQVVWMDDGGFAVETLRPLLDRFLATFTFTG